MKRIKLKRAQVFTFTIPNVIYFYIIDIALYCESRIDNSRFIRNKASLNGGAISYNKHRSLSFFNTNFTNNKALYGSDLAGYPYGVKLISYDAFILASGLLYQGNISVEIVDVDGRRITTD